MRLTLCTFALLATSTLAGAADWRQFRGNSSDGVAPDSDVPTSWSDGENIAWKIPLVGKGLSSPIIVGDAVFLTSSSGFQQDRLHVQRFDVKTGKAQWERQFWATGRTMRYPTMPVASPTPASDGKRIFALYSSNDLACLDLNGNLLWYRGLTFDYPNVSNSLGMASSPVVVGDTLVVQVECDDESFALGLDAATGIHRWKISRPRIANWTSASLLRGKTPELDSVLLASGNGIEAVDPANGKTRWKWDKGASTIPSPVISAETVFIPSNGIAALRQAADGTASEQVWHNSKLVPSTSSPIAYEGNVFTINGTGAVSCGDAATGELKWQKRLQGKFSSTPVAAGGHLYYINEDGKAFVVKPGEKDAEVVGTSEFGERIQCTPAIADNALYVRGDSFLWKIAK